jgi:hypothetical protein
VKKQLVQYSGLIFATAFAFGNFVACGAKMYQVSLEGDSQHRRTLGAETGPSGAADHALSGGEQIYPGIHAPGGWTQLPIPYKFSSQLSEEQKIGLKSAMKTWETAVGMQLFVYKGDDSKRGDNFDDLYSSLNDSVNGHYSDDNWEKTGKSEMVLATTIWDTVPGDEYTIDTADIRFNSEHYIIGDSFVQSATAEREVVDMESLALHELGHLLGLSHIGEESDPYSIMNPTLYIGEGLANRKISRDDIERLQRIYGCEGDACNVDELFSRLETEATSDESSEYAH